MPLFSQVTNRGTERLGQEPKVTQQWREIWFQGLQTPPHPTAPTSQSRGGSSSVPGLGADLWDGGVGGGQLCALSQASEGVMAGCWLCVLSKRAGSSPAEPAGSRKIQEGVPRVLGPDEVCASPGGGTLPGVVARSWRARLTQRESGWNLPQSTWVGVLRSAIEKTESLLCCSKQILGQG